MKTDTVNTEKWTLNLFNEDETHVYFDIDCGEDEIGQLKLNKNYRNDDLLISTAVNACKDINPDNPLNVANGIPELYDAAVTAVVEYFSEVNKEPKDKNHWYWKLKAAIKSVKK